MAATPPAMTTEFGNKVADSQHALTAGPRGPVLMQDFVLMEKMARFNRERVPERDAASYKWHPFDLTKVWPHSDYPLIEVGTMELNRNPENYFAEVEQAVFEPSNVIPGIGFSPDKVLQARVLSYGDAHRYRLGVNYHQAPINRPLAHVATYNRDGTLRVDGNGGGEVDYEPNSFGGPVADASVKEPPLALEGAADRYVGFACDDDDYYGQPRMLWEKALDETGRQPEQPGHGPRRPQRHSTAHAGPFSQNSPRFRQARGRGSYPEGGFVMTELSTNDRNALPDRQFGLPEKRAYPMPDASHARNAKARAAEEFNKGNLTAAEKAQIDAKADKILGET